MDGKWQLGGYAEALDELMERRIQIETSAENCGGFSFSRFVRWPKLLPSPVLDFGAFTSISGLRARPPKSSTS
jgi:hypothetical protein